jgi:hypothetical protein
VQIFHFAFFFVFFFFVFFFLLAWRWPLGAKDLKPRQKPPGNTWTV